VTIIHVNLGQPLQGIIGNSHCLTAVNRKAAWISEQNLNDPQFSLYFTSMYIGAHVSAAERSPTQARYLSLPICLFIYPKTGHSFFLPVHSNKRARIVFLEISSCTSAHFNRRWSCYLA